jgi:hypothetical protein
MKWFFRFGVMVIAVLALVGAGTVGWTVASAHSPVQPQALHPQAVRPSAFIDTSTESKYTAITPCRIVDTRSGSGHLVVGVPRVFQVAGTTGFSAQGGTNGGCGVPTSATAVAATVVAVNEAGPGFLVTWPTGSTQPGSSFMNYADTNLVSSGAQIPINASINVLAGVNTTDVVIDIDGYYVKPMFALVNPSGTSTAEASRVTGVSLIGTGEYEVDFDRDVSACSYQVTSEEFSVVVLAQPRALHVDGVFVLIETPGGTSQDDPFYLDVTC